MREQLLIQRLQVTLALCPEVHPQRDKLITTTGATVDVVWGHFRRVAAHNIDHFSDMPLSRRHDDLNRVATGELDEGFVIHRRQVDRTLRKRNRRAETASQIPRHRFRRARRLRKSHRRQA